MEPETPTERKRRLGRESQRRHIARQTPEQAEERRRLARESQQRHILRETPEQAERRKLLAKESQRRYLSRQTPDQAAITRQRNAERQAKRRLTVALHKIPESEEEAKERRRRNAERQRRSRERRKELHRFLNSTRGHCFVIRNVSNEVDDEKIHCSPTDVRCQTELPAERKYLCQEASPVDKLSEDETKNVVSCQKPIESLKVAADDEDTISQSGCELPDFKVIWS